MKTVNFDISEIGLGDIVHAFMHIVSFNYTNVNIYFDKGNYDIRRYRLIFFINKKLNYKLNISFTDNYNTFMNFNYDLFIDCNDNNVNVYKLDTLPYCNEYINGNLVDNFKKPYILLNPTSSTINKDYMYYDKVLYDLYNTYNYKGYVYVIGLNINKKIKKSLTNLNCSDKIIFEDNTTYQKLLDLIFNAVVFVTNDSFPVWIGSFIKSLNYKIIVIKAKIIDSLEMLRINNKIVCVQTCSGIKNCIITEKSKEYILSNNDFYCDKMCLHRIDYHRILNEVLYYTRKNNLSD